MFAAIFGGILAGAFAFVLKACGVVAAVAKPVLACFSAAWTWATTGSPLRAAVSCIFSGPDLSAGGSFGDHVFSEAARSCALEAAMSVADQVSLKLSGAIKSVDTSLTVARFRPQEQLTGLADLYHEQPGQTMGGAWSHRGLPGYTFSAESLSSWREAKEGDWLRIAHDRAPAHPLVLAQFTGPSENSEYTGAGEVRKVDWLRITDAQAPTRQPMLGQFAQPTTEILNLLNTAPQVKVSLSQFTESKKDAFDLSPAMPKVKVVLSRFTEPKDDAFDLLNAVPEVKVDLSRFTHTTSEIPGLLSAMPEIKVDLARLTKLGTETSDRLDSTPEVKVDLSQFTLPKNRTSNPPTAMPRAEVDLGQFMKPKDRVFDLLNAMPEVRVDLSRLTQREET
jgi:hypothetical protein